MATVLALGAVPLVLWGTRPPPHGLVELNQVLPVVEDAPTAAERQTAEGTPLLQTPFAGLVVSYEAHDKRVRAPANPEIPGQAVKNLGTKLGPFEVEPLAANSPVFMLGHADGFDSARLLLIDRWEPLATTVRGDLIAVAPSRDLVLFTGDADPEAIDAMLTFADVVYAADPHPILPVPLRWTPAGWMPFTE